ncbi:hypothetical protein [Citrobacter freundii]|uniref:Uncharacterized protein n=1 Tax=Citrobacter freundii TaxID=546 RepID=A0AA40NLT9_CITFR|nr:hypothetical protein [Citrobacter freundii]KPR55616.1 hypothetical protein AN672_10375 [Citrobacter freundii]
MSGKVNKSAAGKTGTTSEKKDDKATKDTPVPTKPASVAPVITDDSQASQPAVAASDVASDPEPVPGDGGVTVIPDTVSLVTMPSENTGDDLRKHLWQETLTHDHSEAVRIAENVVVLEVRAIPENGFHRAGRFWPHDTVHVFVSDNPDEQILEDAGGKPLQGCVISTDTALRLKAEKMLIVTELATVAGTEADVESK